MIQYAMPASEKSYSSRHFPYILQHGKEFKPSCCRRHAVTRGIGVRYSENGMRALALERTEGALSISGIAAGPSEGNVYAFLQEYGLIHPEAGTAVGLGPGNFLSAYLNREEGMNEEDMEELLRWELGRKMLSPFEDHTVSFTIVEGTGFIFSGLRELARRFRSPSGYSCIVDVEPIAMYNGCEGIGEIDNRPAALVSAEAEGISTVILEDGLPVALESFMIPSGGLSESLPGLMCDGDRDGDENEMMMFVKYISESLSRLAMRGKPYRKKFPERLIISGGGACMRGLAAAVAAKTGIETRISDPFMSPNVEMRVESSRLTGMGPAFTACYGLALRAMEE